jgi:prepilin-type N-terminal cleavage/methylation domain-containing protein
MTPYRRGRDPFGPGCRHVRRAFTLMEVLFAMAIVGVLIVVLYGAIANSVAMVRTSQENQIVTQILSDKLDTIRLYNWDQINSNGFMPTSFTVGIDPAVTNSRTYYTGSIALVRGPITESYKDNLVQVTVKVDWRSGLRQQSRSMSTFVAKNGLTTYMPATP